MTGALIETTNLTVNLTSKPIEPSWIIEGKRVSRSSRGKTAAHALWSTVSRGARPR
jgi:hypothetical protein